jgi:hypothetical protein
VENPPLANSLFCPPLAKGGGGFLMQMLFYKKELKYMIDKISPNPSLPKRGIREELISRCIYKNV